MWLRFFVSRSGENRSYAKDQKQGRSGKADSSTREPFAREWFYFARNDKGLEARTRLWSLALPLSASAGSASAAKAGSPPHLSGTNEVVPFPWCRGSTEFLMEIQNPRPVAKKATRTGHSHAYGTLCRTADSSTSHFRSTRNASLGMTVEENG